MNVTQIFTESLSEVQFTTGPSNISFTNGTGNISDPHPYEIYMVYSQKTDNNNNNKTYHIKLMDVDH
jgi:hypothetical protein